MTVNQFAVCNCGENVMSLNYRYTRHQVARGTRADAERNGTYYLIKNCSVLRLTYQISLLTYLAATKQWKLIIDVPKRCVIDSSLRSFQKEHLKVVRIEKF